MPLPKRRVVVSTPPDTNRFAGRKQSEDDRRKDHEAHASWRVRWARGESCQRCGWPFPDSGDATHLCVVPEQPPL